MPLIYFLWGISMLVSALEVGLQVLAGGQKDYGSRMFNRAFSTSTYAADIHRARGTVRLPGNVIWSTVIQETEYFRTTSKKSGVYSYAYSISIAVAFGRGPCNQMISLWTDGKLLYQSSTGNARIRGTIHLIAGTGLDGHTPMADQGATELVVDTGANSSLYLQAGVVIQWPGDFNDYQVQQDVTLGANERGLIQIWPPLVTAKTVDSPNLGFGAFITGGIDESDFIPDMTGEMGDPHSGGPRFPRHESFGPSSAAGFYPGSSTQMPDQVIEEYTGGGNASAYRDLIYIMLDQLQLANFGNRIPNFTAELAFEPPQSDYPMAGPVASSNAAQVLLPGETSTAGVPPPSPWAVAVNGSDITVINRGAMTIQSAFNLGYTPVGPIVADSDGFLYAFENPSGSIYTLHKYDLLAATEILNVVLALPGIVPSPATATLFDWMDPDPVSSGTPVPVMRKYIGITGSFGGTSVYDRSTFALISSGWNWSTGIFAANAAAGSDGSGALWVAFNGGAGSSPPVWDLSPMSSTGRTGSFTGLARVSGTVTATFGTDAVMPRAGDQATLANGNGFDGTFTVLSLTSNHVGGRLTGYSATWAQAGGDTTAGAGSVAIGVAVAIQRVSNVVTAWVAATPSSPALGFSVGDIISVAGVATSDFDGSFSVVSITPLGGGTLTGYEITWDQIGYDETSTGGTLQFVPSDTGSHLWRQQIGSVPNDVIALTTSNIDLSLMTNAIGNITSIGYRNSDNSLVLTGANGVGVIDIATGGQSWALLNANPLLGPVDGDGSILVGSTPYMRRIPTMGIAGTGSSVPSTDYAAYNWLAAAVLGGSQCYDPSTNSVWVYDGSGLVYRLYLDRTSTGDGVDVAEIISWICGQSDLDPSQYDVTKIVGRWTLTGIQLPHESLRDSILKLLEVFQIDAQERDGCIHFIPRARGPEFLLDADNDAGGLDSITKTEPRMEEVLAIETDIPERIALTYFDRARNFQQSLQYSKRISLPYGAPGLGYPYVTHTRLEKILNTSLTSDATTMKQQTEKMLYESWAARFSYTLKTSIRYLALDGGDVGLIRYQGTLFEVRLVSIDRGAGLALQFKAVSHDHEVYDSFAVAQPGGCLALQ